MPSSAFICNAGHNQPLALQAVLMFIGMENCVLVKLPYRATKQTSGFQTTLVHICCLIEISCTTTSNQQPALCVQPLLITLVCDVCFLFGGHTQKQESDDTVVHSITHARD
jgi:hypothetical protein